MRRVLVYRLGSLGDTVVALPCLNKVRERFPDAERVLLTNNPVSAAAPRMTDILAGSGLFHDVIAYDLATRSPPSLAALSWRLRRRRFDALVYLLTPRGPGSLRRDLAFFRLSGLRDVIGAPVTPDLMFNRLDAQGEEEYECLRLARCLSALGPIDLDDPCAWDLGLSAAERAGAARTLAHVDGHPFVAVAMGTKWPTNDWGPANWSALLGRLPAAFRNLRWVFVGAPGDVERADAIVARHPDRMLNLCGRTAIRETAAVLGRATLFVGHDSGPLHLAAAGGVPCVGLFSTQNRRHKWFPYGSRHRVLYPGGPIALITVDEVFEAVRLMLAQAGSRAAAAHADG